MGMRCNRVLNLGHLGGFETVVLGRYNPDTEQFVPTAGAPISQLDGGRFGWSVTNFYNNDVTAADPITNQHSRMLTFGWLSATCTRCRPQVTPQRLSIIREVRYEPRLQRLVSSPLPELSDLHSDPPLLNESGV